MPETTATPTQLTSQYSTQVATDLERNLKEQAQIREEIEALTGRLGPSSRTTTFWSASSRPWAPRRAPLRRPPRP
ncbi:hypothetical protein NKH77_52820 [Streptomyces sp. M19]